MKRCFIFSDASSKWVVNRHQCKKSQDRYVSIPCVCLKESCSKQSDDFTVPVYPEPSGAKVRRHQRISSQQICGNSQREYSIARDCSETTITSVLLSESEQLAKIRFSTTSSMT